MHTDIASLLDAFRRITAGASGIRTRGGARKTFHAVYSSRRHDVDPNATLAYLDLLITMEIIREQTHTEIT